jgi:hypothetical protein
MRIKFLRGVCDNARTCPNINLSARSTYVVQGYVVMPEHPLPHGEALVEIPDSLLPELVGAGPRDGLALTGRGTILVRGTQVTDPQVLAELALPSGENAVEVPLSMFRELEASHA